MALEAATISANRSDGGDDVARASVAGAGMRLLCRSGKQYYAIPLAQVSEIMRVPPVESLVGAPPYVRGLSLIRGAPVPVVDLGLLICGQETQSGRLIVIKTGERLVALQVDTVLGIRQLNAGAFGELPPLMRDVGIDTIAAIGALDEELLIALRATQFVPEHVLRDIEREGTQS